MSGNGECWLSTNGTVDQILLFLGNGLRLLRHWMFESALDGGYLSSGLLCDSPPLVCRRLRELVKVTNQQLTKVK